MSAYGGMERHVCSLATFASARGHSVRLLTTSNSLGSSLREELKAAGVALRELPLKRGSARSAASRFLKLPWLLGETLLARRSRYSDIIYTNGQSALARYVWLAGHGKTRIVHHHHTAADAGEQKTWSPAFRKVLQTAPELVGCSDATRSALNLAVNRRDARFLPYLTSCPVEAGQVQERKPGARLRFGFLGRLIPEKGIDLICKLSLDPALRDIEWHLHGAGPAYPAAHFSGYPNIVYHGPYQTPAQHAAALLALDAVTLFSSHNEGMPLTLLEAMSGGLPWIGTNRGGTAELAISSNNTLVVASDSEYSMFASAVLTMAERIHHGETSRSGQRKVYDSHFSPRVVSGVWMDYFEKNRTSQTA